MDYKEDRADELDAITFANTSIYDSSMLDDMEDDWIFRDGWPQGQGRGRAASKLPRRRR